MRRKRMARVKDISSYLMAFAILIDNWRRIIWKNLMGEVYMGLVSCACNVWGCIRQASSQFIVIYGDLDHILSSLLSEIGNLRPLQYMQTVLIFTFWGRCFRVFVWQSIYNWKRAHDLRVNDKPSALFFLSPASIYRFAHYIFHAFEFCFSEVSCFWFMINIWELVVAVTPL